MEADQQPPGDVKPSITDGRPQLKTTYMITDMVLIAMAIAVPLISWVYIPFGGESHWFRRSGTIMVIIGIVLESRLFISKVIMYELSCLPAEEKGGISYRYIMGRTTALLSHAILILGAIISGYGDLLFTEVKFN